MSSQPNYELVAQLGDVDYLEYDGYFVYRDTTGVYDAQAEKLILQEDGTYTVYRFDLDKCTYVNKILSDNKFHPDSEAWFAKDGLYKFADITPDMFCSDDIIIRARAYKMVGEYFGWENLDSDPLQLTRREAKKRYSTK